MQTRDSQKESLPDGRDPEVVSVARDDHGLVYGEPDQEDTFVPDLSGFYTYADYLRMELKGRWELVKGYLRQMSAPIDPHQIAVGALYSDLHVLLRKRTCTARVAPYDVRLFADESRRDTTVVQPDVCVMCDRRRVRRRGCFGAPDLVIEVLSPSTERYDRTTKLALYEQAGVREYWIVDPRLERVELRALQEDGFYPLPTIYFRGDEVDSGVVTGFRVSVTGLMDEANEFADVISEDWDEEDEAVED